MSTQTIAVTGSSGLVGRALCERLRREGYRVRPVVRREASGEEIHWDLAKGILDPADFADVDAVVHLAGESITGTWTPEKKRRIHDSRVEGTRLIAEAIAAVPRRPRVLVSASAVGFYGNRDSPVDESSPKGEGFLADVCEAWEAAAEPARQVGVRVVHPRISIVLATEGGALKEQLPLFRWGVGGPLGSGRQGLPWIHIDDLVSLLLFLVHHDVSGPVNAVAPGLVSQGEFARALGAAIHRPAFLPAPAAIIRLLMGEMGQALLLEGAHVRPGRATDAGFMWTFPELPAAFADLLER